MQTQLDVYGEVVTASYHFVQSGGTLQADERRLLQGFGATACRYWREPDHGIWEIRGARRHYTFEGDVLGRARQPDQAARMRHLRIDTDSFRRERDAIRDAIETRGFNAALNSYVSEFDGDQVDASLLLMGCLGYREPSHPRMRATVDRIRERLGRDGLLYRYEFGADGIPAREGAFGICSFWAVDNLARRGDLQAGQDTFEQVLSCANDVGLFAEEIEVETEQPWATSHRPSPMSA